MNFLPQTFTLDFDTNLPHLSFDFILDLDLLPRPAPDFGLSPDLKFFTPSHSLESELSILDL